MKNTVLCVSIVLGGVLDAPYLFNSFIKQYNGDLLLLSNDEFEFAVNYSVSFDLMYKMMSLMVSSNTHGNISLIDRITGEVMRNVTFQ